MDDKPKIERQAYNVDEFCLAHKISRATYYKLKQQGRGPRTMMPGSQARISLTAAADWRKMMEQDAESRTAQLEHERRRVQSSRAGKLAGQSPLHVCRKKRKGK